MMDWLKFFPFASRDDNNPTEIRGPYFPSLRENKWFLGNCLFRFGAPMANPVFSISRRGTKVKTKSPRRCNILKTQWERVYFSNSNAPKCEWDLDHFYSNTWCFVGPWFTGEQADLRASALLATADKNFSFADKNLFHPRVFESAVANYLDKAYGYSKNGSKPMYRGPLNWHVLPISSSIQAVVCDIHQIGNGSKDNPALRKLIFFPVSPTQFVEILFNFGGVEIYRDEVRAKPLLKLCDSIIETFRLDVGEQTLKEWNAVKETCPDMSITETMGEFPWPLTKAKKSSKKSEVDITPAKVAVGQIQDDSH